MSDSKSFPASASITELQRDPERIVGEAQATQRPVLLTQHGCGVAVLLSLAAYERAEAERAFIHGVATGLGDLAAGREVPLKEAKARFGQR